jgi:hypothetical protein
MPRTYPTSILPAPQLQFAGTIVIAATVANRRHLSTLRAQHIFFLPLAKFAALFHFPAMQSYELLHEVFEKKSAKEVAADLGLSLSMVYKWAQPPNHAAGSGTGNPLDRIEALLASTGDHRLVQWICQRAGGFFILNPKNAPHPHYLIPATNQIVQDFADLLHTIASATADDKISSAEAKQIRARWEELKTVTEGFVACCEAGNFGQMKKDANKRNAADS